MATVHPLRAFVADPTHAAQIAAPPYDVLTTQEARAIAAANPLSFLHVTKPEIDCAEGAGQDVYLAQGQKTLQRFYDDGLLLQDETPCFYAYALRRAGHTQVGIVLGADVGDYRNNVVRKHEQTRAAKEAERVAHMRVMQAQTGKVFLLHRAHSGVSHVLQSVCCGQAHIDFIADDGISHTLWRIDDAAHVRALVDAFADIGPLYIADGHHRAAAAARVAETAGSAAAQSILATAFSADQVEILPYHRIVADLGTRSFADILAGIQKNFAVRDGMPDVSQPDPADYVFGMYAGGAWRTLRRPRGSDKYDTNAEHMLATLDVSVLQDLILAPLLGIHDPRRDARIDFVGGIHGTQALQRRVGDSAAVAFCMQPAALLDMLAVADVGGVMPPKSTWFEPKLRDGLVVSRFV